MMKPETLRALLVDREFGELPPEVSELLDAYLEVSPAARAEAEAAARTIGTARETVRRHPELAPTVEAEAEARVIPIFYWLARVAALIAVAALAGWFGYRLGQSSGPAKKPATAATAADPRFAGLWTRYQVAYDARRGTYVVAQE
jgi:hypothetical protein